MVKICSYLNTSRHKSKSLPNPRKNTDAALCDLLAVYGTLRRRSTYHKLPSAASRLQFFSCGLIAGRLFWQRTYPVLIQDRGIAQVELFRIVDPNVFDDLDRYEGFDPRNLRASLFIRTQVLLLNPQVRAWAYFLNPRIQQGTYLPTIPRNLTIKQTPPQLPLATSAKDTEGTKN